MAKILFIIAPKNFRDEELKVPMQIARDTGHKCVLSSLIKGKCTGMLGYEVEPDILVSEAKADEYDAVVLVGGSGSPELANHDEVIKLLNEIQVKGKVVAAICLAPVVLAKAGLLKGKKATVYQTPDTVKTLENAGAVFINEPVVVDGKLVTACGPSAAAEFARAILTVLGAEARER